jgi:hypothetical protein
LVAIDWTISLDEGDNKCIQNFGGELTWKAVSCKTEKKCEDNINMKIVDKVWKWMKVAQERDQ